MKRCFIAALAVFAAMVTAPVAEAGPREDVMSGASRCFQLSDDRAWLACYFAAARPMQSALGTNAPAAPSVPAGAPAAGGLAFGAAPAQAAYAPPPPEEAEPPSGPSWFSRLIGNPDKQTPQAFGREDTASNGPAPPAQLVDHIVARVTKYSFWGGGYFTVTLDNGQVWQQISGEEDFAPLKSAASNYIVTIEHGYFGDFSLTFRGIKALYRVHRIS